MTDSSRTGARTPEMFMGSQVLAEVLSERQRQIQVEGWTPEHDDQHWNRALAMAAASYAAYTGPVPPAIWPFDSSWWKPKDRRRDLIRAAALIVAEIERLDRAQP